MRRRTLTAIGVARSRAPDDPRRRRMEWDAVVPGLALRITATGAKSWVLVTRLKGRVIWDTLGKPPGLSLPAARDLARDGLDLVARGEDPRERRRPAKRTDPERFEAVAADFVEKWSKPRNRTWEETERTLAHDVIPRWRGRRLGEIGRGDVVALVDEIASRAPIQANRTLAAIKKLFAWALDRGLIEAHPVARLSPPAPERTRDRVLTDAELRALWGAWTAMAYPWGIACKLVLLTACRRGEVEEMAWSELGMDRLWTIPPARIKAKLPLVLPLAAPAVELLASVVRIDGCPYVLTTRPPRPIRDWSGAVKKASKLSGVTGWSMHDLRRTCRTGLSRLGVPADIAERTLGHVIPGVRRVYDRYEYLAEKRDALEKWAAHLASVVTAHG